MNTNTVYTKDNKPLTNLAALFTEQPYVKIDANNQAGISKLASLDGLNIPATALPAEALFIKIGGQVNNKNVVKAVAVVQLPSDMATAPNYREFLYELQARFFADRAKFFYDKSESLPTTFADWTEKAVGGVAMSTKVAKELFGEYCGRLGLSVNEFLKLVKSSAKTKEALQNLPNGLAIVETVNKSIDKMLASRPDDAFCKYWATARYDVVDIAGNLDVASLAV